MRLNGRKRRDEWENVVKKDRRELKKQFIMRKSSEGNRAR